MLRSTGRPTALLTTAFVVALVAAEVWALSLPILADMQAGFPASWSARDSSILLDLVLVVPLTTFLLIRVWNQRSATAPAGTERRATLPPWVRAWLRPRRLLYLLVPPLLALLTRLDLGLGGILAAVAALAIIGELFAFGLLAVKVGQLASATRAALQAGYTVPIALVIGAGRAFGALPMVPAMRLAITELAQLYYLTIGWFVPRSHPGGRAFTYHRHRDETLMIAFSILITIEAVPIHVVVHHYGSVAAWILTGLHAYSLLWTLGGLAAVRHRPHLLSGARLRLTDGLWREAVVELDNIAAVIDGRGADDPPEAEATFGSRMDVRLELAEPVPLYGMLGGEREVRTLSLALDDAEGFLETMAAVSVPVSAPANQPPALP